MQRIAPQSQGVSSSSLNSPYPPTSVLQHDVYRPDLISAPSTSYDFPVAIGPPPLHQYEVFEPYPVVYTTQKYKPCLLTDGNVFLNWPPELPEPRIVAELLAYSLFREAIFADGRASVVTFFDLASDIPGILDKHNLISRLSAPPPLTPFPHPALIYVICGYAASRTNSGEYGDEFVAEQIFRCKDAIFAALEDPSSLVDTVRALVILTQLLLEEARMMDAWTFGGLASQMITSLQWHLHSDRTLFAWAVRPPPPLDQLDRNQGTTIFWMAFLNDTIASLGSSLAATFVLDEITAPLPSSRCYPSSRSRQPPSRLQYPDSLDLWTNHIVIDPFVMLIKSSILLHRAIKYARLCKARQYDGKGVPRDDAHNTEYWSLTDAIGNMR